MALAQEGRATDGVPDAVDGGLDAAPGVGAEAVGRRDLATRVRAAATIARASGCSLSDSTAAARRSTSDSSSPPPAATPVTTWAPFVRVPVLSNSTVSIDRMRSSASRSFTRIPARADTAVESDTTSGIASPSACGQAMTRTVTRPHDGVVGVAERRPDDEREQPRGGGDVEEEGGEAVGEHLRPAVARLGIGHQALDPGQCGVVADRVDPHADRGVGGHRPRDARDRRAPSPRAWTRP